MKKKSLFVLWICLYALCGLLGLIASRSAVGSAALTALGIGFFIPGFALLYKGYKENDRKLLRQLRLISALSLALTTVLLVVTIICVGAGDTAGVILNIALDLVSVPAFCLHFQGIGPFLWACMLIASFPKILKI